MRISDSVLQTRTGQEAPGGEKAARILEAALSAVDPARLIQKKLSRCGDQLSLPDEEIDLGGSGRIFLLGLGKAARPMTLSLADLLQDQLDQGYIITKGIANPLPPRHMNRVEIFSASHPLPGKDGLEASAKVLDGLSSLREEDLVIILISGGGSALFVQPAQGISLAQLQITNQVLLDCGADIGEINTIRKHLSRVKGGQLAKHLKPARILTLVLSDVIGDPLDMIASGPTVPDRSTFEDALAVVDKFGLQNQLPVEIVEHLARGVEGHLPETPKPGAACFKRAKTIILGGNQDALKGGMAQAETEGFHTSILPNPLEGEARAAGISLALKLKDLAQSGEPLPRPACLITGGETTVSLTGTAEPGLGGRNLELALSAIPILAGQDNCLLVALASDGEDGVSGAAGAVVSGSSFSRCQQMGLDPAQFLERHDSFTLFQTLGDLLLTGPTGTNVNDLCFLFTF